jgi:hypothetical protein
MACIEFQVDRQAEESNSKTLNLQCRSFIKRAEVLDPVVITAHGDGSPLARVKSMKASAFIFEYMSVKERLDQFLPRLSILRTSERGGESPALAVLSLLNAALNLRSDEVNQICKFTYMNGLDAILLRASSPEDVQYMRDTFLGLRGRRVKLFVEGTKNMSIIQASDGVFVDNTFDSTLCRQILKRGKLIFTSDPSLTDACNVDVLVYPTQESSTPPTTEPSTPTDRSTTSLSPRSYLFSELLKFIDPSSTQLVIALADDGSTAIELSVQSRLQKTRIPLILALTASESVYGYMGCLYGVVPLRMQSFVSVSTVISNAIDHAKERGLVKSGDAVAVVLVPPPVTASTNERCFEGVVQSRLVE